MMSRNIIRCVAPRAFKFYSSAVTVRSSKLGTTLTSQPSPSLSSNLKVRLYSQANAENLPVVDYDYVKRASSQNEVTIIDVREPDEIKEHGKIPNSVNIPLGNINTSLALSEKEFQQTYNIAKPNENAEIIFYCKIGRRSGMAQQQAISLGYKNVKNYLGSWTDWAVKNQ